MSNTNRTSTAATVNAVLALAEAIRALGSVPSGHLYARVMGYLNVGQYDAIIATLIGAGLVKNESYLLTWIGPQPKAVA